MHNPPETTDSTAGPIAPIIGVDDAGGERMTVGAAANYLGISAPTLKAWTHAGRVKLYVITPTGRYLYLRRDIVEAAARMRAAAEARILERVNGNAKH